MYNRLLNSLKQGFQTLKNSARSVRTRSNSVSSSSTNFPSEERNSCERVEDIENEITQQQAEEAFGPTQDNKNKRLKEGPQKTQATKRKISQGTASSEKQRLDLLNVFGNENEIENWIKVVLALRLVSSYVRPLIDDTIKKVHRDCLRKHETDRIPKLLDKEILNKWNYDIRSHYHSNGFRRYPGDDVILKMCKPHKWISNEGLWEFGRAFMSRGQRNGPKDKPGNVEDFDTPALLNLMLNMNDFERKINSPKNIYEVTKIRNSIMHNSKLEVSQEELGQHFKQIALLLEDETLRNTVAQYDILWQDYVEFVDVLKDIRFGINTSMKKKFRVSETVHPSRATTSSQNPPSTKVETDLDLTSITSQSDDSQTSKEYPENSNSSHTDISGSRKRQHVAENSTISEPAEKKTKNDK